MSTTTQNSISLEDLIPQLLNLTIAEKAKAIQILSQSLANIWQGIEKTPGVCGGRACIARTRIPVWVLVNARKMGYSDADLLDNYPTLSAEDLVNTWSYAENFSEEINYDIWENERED